MAAGDSPQGETERAFRDALFTKAIDGDATETDLAALSDLVCSDEAACREYAELATLEALLAVILAEPLPGEVDTAAPSLRARSTDSVPAVSTALAAEGRCVTPASGPRAGRFAPSRRRLAVAAVAVTVAVVVGVVALQQPNPGDIGGQHPAGGVEPDARQQAFPRGFGVLAEQADTVWQSGMIPTGSILPPGQLALEAGTAQLELFSGVQLVVEGRAVFTVESPLRVVLHEGAARALVPDAAHGFEVVTPAAAIVDLGTEFALRVDGSTTDVTVLQGAVEVVKTRNAAVRVDSGRSFRLRKNSVDLEELVDGVNLPSATAVAEAARDRRRENFARWRSTLNDLEADGRLIGRYCVANPACSRTVPNHADRAAVGSDAAVVGAECTTDRWGRQFAAVDFTRSGSRLRLTLPGQFAGLTMACWVKVNSLSNDYNALLLTDGHDLAEPHWQILRDGRLFFSVKHPQVSRGEKSQKVFYSPSFWREEMSGRWIMLAVTYDRGRGLVRHFVNGAVVSREPIPEWALATHVQIGDASIANWAEPVYRSDAEFTSRNLSGSIDEFLIFAAPLAEEEIMSLYTSGDPDR